MYTVAVVAVLKVEGYLDEKHLSQRISIFLALQTFATVSFKHSVVGQKTLLRVG